MNLLIFYLHMQLPLKAKCRDYSVVLPFSKNAFKILENICFAFYQKTNMAIIESIKSE